MQSKLDEREQLGNYRTLRPENSFIDFCSNDYLGFARSPVLTNLVEKELVNHPVNVNGATGSRLLSGNLAYTEKLEEHIAAFHGAAAGLLFNSGYDANLGLLSSLPQKDDTIIYDELIHASVIDGARLSYANRYKFSHNNLESLEGKLKQAKGNCYVVVESVYSMDGDTPPLAGIVDLTKQYGANLIVDEAHATGLYPQGLISHLNLQNDVFARVVTFGKALGCHGAVVLGSDILRNYLINFARSFIYTTAAPFHQLAVVKMAYELIARSGSDIARLHQNINYFKQGLKLAEAYSLLLSNSPIQCITAGSNSKAKYIAQQLQTAGMDVRPILSPTVAQGAERIRICLHAYNTTEEIDLLLLTLNNITYAL